MVYFFSTQSNELNIYLYDILSSQWNEVEELKRPYSLEDIKEDKSMLFFLWETDVPKNLVSKLLLAFPQSVFVLIYRDRPNTNLERDFDNPLIDFYIRYETVTSDYLYIFNETIRGKRRAKELENTVTKLENSILEWQNIFQDSLDLIFIIESETKKILQTNRTSMLVLGYSEAELIGMDFSNLTKSPKSEEEDGAEIHGSSIINQGLRNSEGKWIPMESTWRLLQRNDETAILATFRDISERKEAEQKIQQLAFYNSITNLPNRVHFEEIVKNLSLISKNTKELFAIIVMDIDNFKLVNDSIGSERGNELLKLVGSKIISLQPTLKNVSHFGGDEFGGILQNFKSIDELEITLIQLQNQLRNPYQFEDRELHLTMSIGVAIFPNHGDNSTQLLKAADMAMYSSKERGRNISTLYSTKMIEKVKIRLELENDMRSSLKAKEFEVYFQPQVDLKSGELCGAEALVRWNHPSKGMVYPGVFIEAAEESGIIFDIGLFVLKQTCKIASDWYKEDLLKFPLSVNFSAKQWNGHGTTKEILKILTDTGLPPNFLTIELTESSVMQNPEKSIMEFQELIQNGVSLSVDDFGTGYSSLSYLKKLHVHHLKIDKSFVQELEKNENDRAICKAIINMAHSLGLSVVAEGVETKEQLKILQEEGCDIIQGYLISKPIPQKEFEELLAKYRFKNYEVVFSV
ncbi:MAG: EAL domain-containing protein [Leptospira sp.]|nr:EAL domain-containing protein [Leptospira sp.]NCS93767.1 EAL domain-containing protein [Leptospira sp.]